MLKEKQQVIEKYFEEHGIPVQTSFIRGGLSIYASNRKTPIARFEQEKRVASPNSIF